MPVGTNFPSPMMATGAPPMASMPAMQPVSFVPTSSPVVSRTIYPIYPQQNVCYPQQFQNCGPPPPPTCQPCYPGPMTSMVPAVSTMPAVTSMVPTVAAPQATPSIIMMQPSGPPQTVLPPKKKGSS